MKRIGGVTGILILVIIVTSASRKASVPFWTEKMPAKLQVETMAIGVEKCLHL